MLWYRLLFFLTSLVVAVGFWIAGTYDSDGVTAPPNRSPLPDQASDREASPTSVPDALLGPSVPVTRRSQLANQDSDSSQVDPASPAQGGVSDSDAPSEISDQAEFSDQDFADHVRQLRKQHPGDEYTIVVQKPFVVIGNESPELVKQRSRQTVQWAVQRLKKQYFGKDPKQIIDIWLLKDEVSYQDHCQQIVGHKATTPFGFYSSRHRVLMMNISTGGGTLVHEIVHPFMESNFPGCPAWFNEGLASLYEQSQSNANGEIVGLTNWRLRGLQMAIKDQTLPRFETLCKTTTNQFYQEDPGTNYAQARYLCFYLQQQGKLRSFYHQFVAAAETDRGGYQTLQDILKTDDMDQFQADWQKYVMGLRFP